MRESFRRAVHNVAAWGDTDVFPLPLENLVFYDSTEEVLDLLDDLHTHFAAWTRTDPPDNAEALAMVGYTAFRWVTQVDPLWNAYLLGLVLSIAPDIERARIPAAQRVIFSYRYETGSDADRLFTDSAWRDFNLRSVELAQVHDHVVVCDIADFYARIYHHRLENALLALKAGPDTPRRIMQILSLFSQGTSYGLPVGGPAARILSELLLNRVDRLLLAEGIQFCRFADDYHLFTNSREAAYDALRFISEKLLQNEGLTLQRAKTRVLTAKDFLTASAFSTTDDNPIDGETPEEHAQRSFLSLSLRYDPYSPTAREDYASLSDQIRRFDIVGMLARELSKSRIHSTLARRLLQAIRYLDPIAKESATRALVDNIETLAPVFPSVMRALTEVFDELTPETRNYIASEIRSMLSEHRYYVTVPVNLAYAVRLLAHDPNDANQALLAQIYEAAPDFVKRDIVLAMGRWQAVYWLSDQRTRYPRMHPSVQRAFIVCSYLLSDEGDHWRRRMKGQFSSFDQLIVTWAAERGTESPTRIPI